MPLPETNASAAPPSLSADIAAFIAEGHRPEAPVVPADQTEAADEAAEADEGAEPAVADDADQTEADVADEPEEKPKPAGKDSEKVDVKKLQAAVDAVDLPAFLAALGPAAEKLLTSKAHKALRLQSKELSKQLTAATQAETKAESIATKLNEKYADPIAVRKAVQEGKPEAVDLFIDHAEKTTGVDWNTLIKWVAKGLVGRPERLVSKDKVKTEAATKDTSERAAAVEQAKAWVTAEVTKVDAQLLADMPELADMVLDEIRQGFSAGVDNPKKALPLALKKLRAQHTRIGKLLERTSKPKTRSETPAPAPAARAHRAPTDPKTAPKSLGEDIAEFMRDNNLSRR